MTRIHPLRVRAVTVLALSGLLFAACSDGSDSVSVTGSHPAATPVATTTVAPGDDATATAEPTAPAPQQNLTEGCVEDYRQGVDYFPEKITMEEATHLSVRYEDNYKAVEVTDANPSGESFSYVFVQCGTPVPTDVAGATVVEVPVESAVVFATSLLPVFDAVGRVDVIAGVGDLGYISTESVLARSEGIRELGSPARGLDAEALVEIGPDVSLANTFGSSAEDIAPLEVAGTPVVVAEYREATPLARAEWMKLAGLLLNEEAAVQQQFAEVAADYAASVELAADADQQPSVLLNSAFDGTWFIPGGQSYPAQFVADAGGRYVFADRPGTAADPLDVEAVLNEAVAVDVWLNPGFGILSLEDLRAADERHTAFSAYRNGQVWNNDLAATPGGGDNFFELGVVRPDLVLRDVIWVLYPQLLPDHQPVFYRQVQ